MKLRPTEADYKVLDSLKVSTNQLTYSKAIMVAAEAYPKQRKEIADLKAAINKQTAILQKIDSGSGIMLGSLKAIQEYCNGIAE